LRCFPDYGVNKDTTKPFLSGETIMSLDKFKQLHNLVINEDHSAASELFHEIVLEKSRSIFESLMHDEDDMDEGMGGQVGDMLDEIEVEESGMMEDDEADIDFDDSDDMLDSDDDGDFGDEEAEHEEIEDAVIRIEDKLDQLMAEFEELMGQDEEDDGDEEDYDDSEDAFGGEEDDSEDFGDEEDDEEAEDMMEAVQLQKIGNPVHGDNGSQPKSTVAFNSGQEGMKSKPVKFSGDTETVPTGPKSPSNSYTKGETSVKGAGSFKNSPGHKGLDLDSAPKAKHGDDGSNKRSPVAESRRRTARRPIR